jgi:lipoprotein-anchoring transpeptidase ErfK/SrfK
MYGPFGADAEDEGIPADNNFPIEPDVETSFVASDVLDANETLMANQTLMTADESEPVEPNMATLSVTENTETRPLPEVVSMSELEPNLPTVAGVVETFSSTEPNPQADTLIAEAAALINQGSTGYLEARETLNQALRMSLSAKQKEYVKEQLSELSNRWLFSRTVLPGDPLCENYRVKPGDILEVIGKEHKVPYEILMEINNIRNARSLQAGQTIKLINGPFHAKVHRSTFTMDIYLQNTYVRSFTVGLGKPGRETPTGLWRLRPGGKAHATVWRDPDTGKLYQPEDPNYPLGSRWMALEGLRGEAKDRQGFGIHGTKEPDQIGTAGSRGCIRMFNGEAIMVYNMLVDGLSQVEVTD